jgi:hypothetical protein
MKALVAVIGGFFSMLLVFAGGALTALYFVNAEPGGHRPLDLDTTALWTNKAVTVNAPATGLERLPSEPATRKVQQEPAEQGTSANDIDSLTTGAMPAEDVFEPRVGMNDAHVRWCFARYRSYDPGDNGYNSFSGVRRQCISPYLEGDEEGAAYAQAIATEGTDGPFGYVGSPEHVQSCFDRYRSYRPEDNSYQPFGGGPRVQCQ